MEEAGQAVHCLLKYKVVHLSAEGHDEDEYDYTLLGVQTHAFADVGKDEVCRRAWLHVGDHGECTVLSAEESTIYSDVLRGCLAKAIVHNASDGTYTVRDRVRPA